FREGDTTYDVMVLLDGTVAVLVGSGERMRELAIQRPRDLMAELNILTGQRVHATGVVREAGSILVVPADEFRALLGRELVFGDFVLQTLFRRRQAIERLRMGIQIVGSASTATRTGSASSPPATACCTPGWTWPGPAGNGCSPCSPSTHARVPLCCSETAPGCAIPPTPSSRSESACRTPPFPRRRRMISWSSALHPQGWRRQSTAPRVDC